jgi:5-(carboxyamino)imidazole ribonucleotide synthase
MIAMKIAKKTIAAFDGAGVFGIEMFVTVNENVLVNEISPRPHNSGHYSIEACSVSQFEQHLRAVLDFPLSRPELLSPVVMVNILGPEDYVGPYIVTGLEELFSLPGVKIHIYGKKISKPKRKLGHITATAKNLEQALSRAGKARKAIQLEASR